MASSAPPPDTSPPPTTATTPGPTASSGALGRGIFVVLVLLSLGGWGGVAWYLHQRLPEQAFEEQVTAFRNASHYDPHIPSLCETERGRDAITRRYDELEGDARDALEQALFRERCFDLLDDDTQRAFFRRHGDWALDIAAEVDITVDDARDIDVLVHGQPSARVRAAARLAARTASLSETHRAEALRVAEEATRWPWGMRLLKAFDGEDAAAAFWRLHQADGETSDAWRDTVRTEVLARWSELPEAARETLLDEWLAVRWVARSGGSHQRAQPVMLEVRWRAHDLTGPLSNCVVYVRATSFKINDEEAVLEGRPVHDHIGGVVLDAPSHWRRTIDLRAILLSTGRKREGERTFLAEAEVVLLPAEARGQDVLDKHRELRPEWRNQALYSKRFPFGPHAYQINLKADAEPPKTLHDKALDKQVVKGLHVVWNMPDPVPLRAKGALVKHAKPLPYRHGPWSELVLSKVAPIDVNLALRFQAKRLDPDKKGSWIDLGNAVLVTNEEDTILPVDLSPVCPEHGLCQVALRLRPSLFTARIDPRVVTYWGGLRIRRQKGQALQLGVITIKVVNADTGHQWEELQRRLHEWAKNETR